MHFFHTTSHIFRVTMTLVAGDLIQAFRRTLARINEIEKRIADDQVELNALRSEVDELRRALRETAPATARDIDRVAGRKRPIRDSSTVGYAKRVLGMAGQMHVDEIIRNIEHMVGRPVSKATLVSNLSRYVKAGDTFKRVSANTFALIGNNEKEIRLVG